MTNPIKPMQRANGEFVSHGDYVVVPAHPGFYAIDRRGRGDWDKPFDFEKIAVVAWLVEVCDFTKNEEPIVFVKPICAEMLSSLHMGEVLAPDGHVFNQDGGHWDTFEIFLEQERIRAPNLQTAAFNRAEASNAASV